MRRGVEDPESVADHMYRMGVMALIASDIPGIDRDKLVSSSYILLFFIQATYLLKLYTSLYGAKGVISDCAFFFSFNFQVY